MKTLKIIFISLLFFAASRAQAQIVEVHNGTTITFNPVSFNFSGGVVNFTVLPASNSNKPFIGTLNAVSASFTDGSCSPPVPVTINFPTAPMPVIQQYTLCNGTVVTFVIYFTGTNYIMTIAWP